MDEKQTFNNGGDKTELGNSPMLDPFANNYNTRNPNEGKTDDIEFEGGKRHKIEKKETTKPEVFMKDQDYFFDYNNINDDQSGITYHSADMSPHPSLHDDI